MTCQWISINQQGSIGGDTHEVCCMNKTRSDARETVSKHQRGAVTLYT